MALKTFGSYRSGKRFSVRKPMEKLSDTTVIERKITGSLDSSVVNVVKIVGAATMPDVNVVGFGRYQSSGLRAAKLRSKVDQAIRESDEDRRKAEGSGDMVVIAG
jgi:hypothetical protein